MTDRQDQASDPTGWLRAYSILRWLAHPLVWLVLAALSVVALKQWRYIEYNAYTQPVPVRCVNAKREAEVVTGWKMKDTFFRHMVAQLELTNIRYVSEDIVFQDIDPDASPNVLVKKINKIWVTRDIIQENSFYSLATKAARKSLAADRARCIITITLEDEKKGVPLEDARLTCDEMRTVAYWPSRAAKDAYYDVDQACMAKRREREVLPPPAKPK